MSMESVEQEAERRYDEWDGLESVTIIEALIRVEREARVLQRALLIACDLSDEMHTAKAIARAKAEIDAEAQA